MTVKPFIYVHELLRNGGGVWLGCDSEEITRASHIDGDTGEEVIALYHMDDYEALLSINSELLEAFETATKNVIAFVIELELGKPATSAQIEKTIQLAKPGTMVGDMVAAIAKARSQS